MRTAIYLAWAADVAWQHSTLLGFGRDWYSARGLFWLVRAVRLDVLRPIPTYGEVFVSTQVVAFRRIAAHRRSEVRGGSGELLALIEIDWVMTNERGVPTRVPEEMLRFVSTDTATFEMMKVALPATPPGAFEQDFRVRRRELDPLDHVNNSVYIDYLEEALEEAGKARSLRPFPDVMRSTSWRRLSGATCWPAGRGRSRTAGPTGSAVTMARRCSAGG